MEWRDSGEAGKASRVLCRYTKLLNNLWNFTFGTSLGFFCPSFTINTKIKSGRTGHANGKGYRK
jgi:hypothetical protein